MVKALIVLGTHGPKAYLDGCVYHYWKSKGPFYQTPETDQYVLPLRTSAWP